ncbi:Phenylacetic acid catabolic protein [Paracoccus sp. p3-h83]|uniref:Phenylacetic acid catabolic protein n=1 Tax=Paracoccus sp. p3-h83 TaxID=3342805 RepID=UPI0035BB2FAC
MSDATMTIDDYLAQGGKLGSPENVPARYRGEVMRMMASFVDSELAGSAGFADVINDAPGITERIAAARIVLEKADHAQRVLAIMGTFGADQARYATQHPWQARLPRDADIGATRQAGDMRLAVFHYPLQGWTDAVVFNLLMGLAGTVQLAELARVSYQPLAEVFRAILPREQRHLELAQAGMERLVGSDPDGVRASVAYWRPRVAASFGGAQSERFARLARMGLRHDDNATLAARWNAAVDKALAELGL